MTRTSPLSVLVVAVALAACGGAATPATTAPGARATTPAGATTLATAAAGQATPQPTSPPQGGGAVSVTLTGGADPGTHTGVGDPHCSHNFIGKDVWGVAFVNEAAGAGEIGAANVIAQAAAEGDASRPFGADVTIGAPFVGNNYALVRDSGDEGQSVAITDNGATAIIHVVGTSTIGTTGVGIDMTVNCPSVLRP